MEKIDEKLFLEMKRLINLGADVIMTDCPDVAYELLKEMGY